MSDENFLLVSLKEDETKHLAQVISNDTSRRILDYLARVKDATESAIAKKLNLPISTVHYNLSALLKARLVQADEFHYSEKGKEVNHYSLANKYVIIAPKEASETLRTKLKRILPVALLGGCGALVIQIISMLNAGRWAAPPQALKTTAEGGANDAAPIFAERTADAAEAASTGVQTELANRTAESTSVGVQTELVNRAAETAHLAMAPNLALWFLYGVAFTIIVFVVVDWIQRRNRK